MAAFARGVKSDCKPHPEHPGRTTDTAKVPARQHRSERRTIDVSGETLIVDPAALTSAATAFGQAGAGLADLGADGPLGQAAAAVPQLATASACQNAQSAIAADTTAVAEAADTYGSNLDIAANRYETQDLAAAETIDKVQPPS